MNRMLIAQVEGVQETFLCCLPLPLLREGHALDRVRLRQIRMLRYQFASNIKGSGDKTIRRVAPALSQANAALSNAAVQSSIFRGLCLQRFKHLQRFGESTERTLFKECFSRENFAVKLV